MADATPPDTQGNPLDAVPGLVRIAAGAWWRTTGWTLGVSLKTGQRLISGQSPGELVESVGLDLREQARRFLGILDPSVPSPLAPMRDAEDDPDRPAKPDPNARVPTLRERGEELLRRSADVDDDDEAHPAYDRILAELAPDEGRILRLLALEGPQPSVDVRTAPPLGIGSQLTAPGLTMIGAQAGCRRLERVPAYLNNLYRLGLVWFSREPVPGPTAYQVLEAQPDVQAALRQAGRARTIRRSIHLTPFGEDFCALCLPLHTAEIDLLPGDAVTGATGL